MFRPKASPPQNAISVIFDLEGFSRFFNQPDVSEYLPKFLNHIFDAVQICMDGGKVYWTTNTTKDYSKLPLRIAQRKFMGDGALYILLPPIDEGTIAPTTARTLCNRFWNLKNNFGKVIERCSDDVPVFDLPAKIRFGVARGPVLELTEDSDSSTEYAGFCINLASRLQKYCPPLGFIGSARLDIKQAKLQEHGYTKVVATAIRGFPKEVVFVDKDELADLRKNSKEEYEALFEPFK